MGRRFYTSQMAAANRLYSPGENLGAACVSPSSTSRLMCYDLAGNMIRDKHVSNAGWMTYDAENKMVRHNAGNTLNDPSVYQYDADGRRKESYTDYNGTTRYIHGLGGELIYEYVSFDNWKEYAYRNGDLLVTASNQGDLKWLVKDHLGTPRIILDKNGTKTRHDYLPFGEEIGNTVGGRSSGYGYPSYPQSDGVKQQFTGYERDIETSLDFAQARYYGSALGRFTSVDPENAGASEDDPQRWNGYSYSGNNPVLYVDPDGRDYKVCYANGECYNYTNAQFKKYLEGLPEDFSAVGNKKNGAVCDSQDCHATYSYFTTADQDAVARMTGGKAGMLTDYFLPKLKAAGDLLPFVALPGASGAVEGVLTQGGKTVAGIEGAISGVTVGANLVKNSSSQILEKTGAGALEAVKDFNTLAKFADKVVTKGTTKIAELRNGFTVKLRPSSDGRATVEIIRRSKEIGSGSGKTIKIRYGTR